MKRVSIGIAGVSLVSVLAACAGVPAGPGASAELIAKSGSQVAGSVTFTPVGDKLRIEVQASNLSPGEHGFHIHEAGDCSAPDATSAKGHFNPAGKTHGHHASSEHHAGDIPNLVADAGGKVRYSAEVDFLALTGTNGVIGRSVVIHADPDDYKSQPAGNSGKRIACGVVAAK